MQATPDTSKSSGTALPAAHRCPFPEREALK